MPRNNHPEPYADASAPAAAPHGGDCTPRAAVLGPQAQGGASGATTHDAENVSLCHSQVWPSLLLMKIVADAGKIGGRRKVTSGQSPQGMLPVSKHPRRAAESGIPRQ